MAEEKPVPNERLRYERIRRGWTQQELADKIGTTPLNVGRWERGITTPGAHFKYKLCELYEKSPSELGLIPESMEAQEVAPVELFTPSVAPAQEVASPFWNVPYNRNLFFTGREDILALLHDTLLGAQHPVALAQPHAISGLGGIGKTQTIVEYAYRYSTSYEYVLWARADSTDLLTSDFLLIAALLNLPQRNEQDQNVVVKAVLSWLNTHDGWLLILDNADHLEVVSEFIPSAGKGHVLLTTRANSTGTIAQRIELDKMSLDEGMLFLLRRVKRLGVNAALESVSQAVRGQAQAVVEALDGLPLALDQAGAYIDETGCALSDYLKYYTSRRKRLLRTRGANATGHPEPVATTWSLSFEKVEHANPVAAELLRLCAFLHPDEIPETMILQGASETGPVLQIVGEDELELNDAIGELRRYSLIKRDPEKKILNIHRLVQAVIRDEMDEEKQRRWMERAVKMVNMRFADQPVSITDTSIWPQYQAYMPHVQVCADMITRRHISLIEAASLLNKAGTYLSERGRYGDATQLIRPALTIRRQRLGEMHLDVAQSLNALAEAYDTLGKYNEAEPLYQQALAIREHLYGPTHIEVAHCLGNLAWLYREMGKYAQAEEYALRAIAICEVLEEPAYPELAICLNSLGAIYYAQEKYGEAEPVFQRVLAIREQIMGEEQPEFASSLNNLATLYRFLGKYAESEQLLQRALSINERMHGPMHPDVAYNLNNLAGVYSIQERYSEAEPLLLRALAIRQQMLSPQHPSVATSLNGLARLYTAMARFAEAELLFQQALALREQALGPEHPEVAAVLESYAALLRQTRRESEAAALEERMQAIRALQQ